MTDRFHPYLLTAEMRARSHTQATQEWEIFDHPFETNAALPAAETPSPDVQATFHFVVYNPANDKPSKEQLRLKLWSNGTCQTNHSEAHGSWKALNDTQIEIEWHWRGLTPLKKQRFRSIPNTKVWERIDVDDIQWKSLLIPVHCFPETSEHSLSLLEREKQNSPSGFRFGFSQLTRCHFC